MVLHSDMAPGTEPDTGPEDRSHTEAGPDKEPEGIAENQEIDFAPTSPSITSQITSWQTSALFRRNPARLTTRGWNGYTSSDHRAFRYTTPKLRLTASDLVPPSSMQRQST
ncbi:hypothetical protein N0V88_002899 [Collariella sp. IMI 366227]|nr:hypothetical protein N0V88_002899 [Collariella sp. IMI 366227]